MLSTLNKGRNDLKKKRKEEEQMKIWLLAVSQKEITPQPRPVGKTPKIVSLFPAMTQVSAPAASLNDEHSSL